MRLKGYLTVPCGYAERYEGSSFIEQNNKTRIITEKRARGIQSNCLRVAYAWASRAVADLLTKCY